MALDFSGVLIGALTFTIIGVFHPIVIKSEYRFGKRCWPAFLVVGLVCATASVFAANRYLSVALAILAFSAFWGIHELFEQEKRVEKGWYPRNPNRK